MSKPGNTHLSEIERIKAQIDADPDAYFSQTVALTEADFALVGKLIQTYCYTDLNARRIIDLIRHAALGPDKQNAGTLQDAQVFEKLREVAQMLAPGNVQEGIVKAANIFEMHVLLRHQFAHWAARRIAKHDVLMTFTKNARG